MATCPNWLRLRLYILPKRSTLFWWENTLWWGENSSHDDKKSFFRECKSRKSSIDPRFAIQLDTKCFVSGEFFAGKNISGTVHLIVSAKQLVSFYEESLPAWFARNVPVNRLTSLNMICRLSCIYYREELWTLPHTTIDGSCYLINRNLIRVQWALFAFSIVSLVREVGCYSGNYMVWFGWCTA